VINAPIHQIKIKSNFEYCVDMEPKEHKLEDDSLEPIERSQLVVEDSTTHVSRKKRFVNFVTSPSFKHTMVSVGALLLVQFMSNLMMTGMKYSMTYVSPFIFGAFRIVLATPLLFLNARLFERNTPPLWKDKVLFGKVFLVGLFGVSLNQGLVVSALFFTTLTNAAAIGPTVPIFTTIMGIILKRERKSIPKFLGIALSVAGTLILVEVDKISFTSLSSFIVGNLLLIGNTSSYAVYLVGQKPILEQYPYAIHLTAWSFGLGGSLLVIIALFYVPDFIANIGNVPALVWGAILYAGVGHSCYGYILNTWVIKRSSVVLVSIFSCVNPFMGTLLAAFFLGERLTIRNWIASPFILLGLILVIREQVKEKQMEEKIKKASSQDVIELGRIDSKFTIDDDEQDEGTEHEANEEDKDERAKLVVSSSTEAET
jgi:drug/metabolite transporter (DMT)-like permease